jgi:hypothetical protein
MADEIKKESKLVEYQKEVAKDVEIDRISLEERQLKLPAIKAKWVARLMNHKSDIDQLNELYEDALNNVAEKIIKESPIGIPKPVARKQAEDDDLPKRIQKQIKMEHRIVEFLEKTEKLFSGMTYDIKNAIDIIKMETT